jgi:hypothetical protein
MKTEFTFPTHGNHALTGVLRDRGGRGYQSVLNDRCVLSEHGAGKKGRHKRQLPQTSVWAPVRVSHAVPFYGLHNLLAWRL